MTHVSPAAGRDHTRWSIARRCLSIAQIAGVLPLLACSAQYPTVVKIKLATVPVGDSVDVLREPVRENESLRFTWTIETRLEPARYLEWSLPDWGAKASPSANDKNGP